MSDTLSTVVSTKGQVILPKPIRDQLGWNAGTRLTVEMTADGVQLKQVREDFPPARPEDVFGSLHYRGPSISIEDIDHAVLAEAKRRAGD